MKNVVGVPARGKDFYHRPRTISKIIEALEAGSNIQLATPRRVGKTSIMCHLLDSTQYPYYFLFKDVEGISRANDYFKAILFALMQDKQLARLKFWERVKSLPSRFFSSIEEFEIGLDGASVKFKDEASPDKDDYLEELSLLLTNIDLGGKKIIMMIDEFPWAIENILKKEGIEAASHFLQANRNLRIEPALSKKIQFIYAGSISLNATVSKLGISSSINDLSAVVVPPLSPDEARDMISQIVKTSKLTMKEEAIAHLITKIEWLIPFYVQLAIKEAKEMLEKGAEIDQALIDKTFVQIVEYKNHNHFDHWRSRLDGSFAKNELKFVHEVLSYVAQRGTMDFLDIYNLSVKHKVANCKHVLETLKYDGYLNNQDNESTYRFNSPILKLWWQRYVCK